MPVPAHLHRAMRRHLRDVWCAIGGLRRGMGWLLVAMGMQACLAMAAPPAVPPPPPPSERLLLTDAAGQHEAWSHLRTWRETAQPVAVEQVLARRTAFERPTTPRGNLGVTPHGTWLYLPLQVDAASDGQWILDIDYTSLDQVDVYLVEDGQLRSHARIGERVPVAQRPLGGRSHSLPLALTPGSQPELLLRVQTTGSGIVPLALFKQAAWQQRETATFLLQGLMAGVALSMMLYALMQWLVVRERLYLYYAAVLIAQAAFLLGHFGITDVYLFPHNGRMTDIVSAAAALLTIGFTLLMTERILDDRQRSPHLARSLRAVAAAALGVALLHILGLTPYSFIHRAGSVLAPLAVVLALAVAWRRCKLHDPAGPYLLGAWGVYGLCVVALVLMLHGYIEANGFTRYAVQIGTFIEGCVWIRVLGLRQDAARQRATRAEHEQATLDRLAHTDALTGLPNRRGLERHLAVQRHNLSPDRQLVLAVADLDGFKAVNDRLGHDAGDALLRVVAIRLQQHIRQYDVVARSGGDEFVVLARDIPGDAQARQLFQKLVNAIAEPISLAGQSVQIGMSVGYAMAPRDGGNARVLLQRADAAMYLGKQRGKNQVCSAAELPAPMDLDTA